MAIVGGGNSALEAVLDMLKIAEHIDMVSLIPTAGGAVLSSQLPKDGNLTVYLEHATVKIEGDPMVEGIEIKGMRRVARRNGSTSPASSSRSGWYPTPTRSRTC